MLNVTWPFFSFSILSDLKIESIIDSILNRRDQLRPNCTFGSFDHVSQIAHDLISSVRMMTLQPLTVLVEAFCKLYFTCFTLLQCLFFIFLLLYIFDDLRFLTKVKFRMNGNWGGIASRDFDRARGQNHDGFGPDPSLDVINTIVSFFFEWSNI